MTHLKPIRVGIIGLGGVAQVHLQAFELLVKENNHCVELVSVCDVRQDAVNAAVSRVAEKGIEGVEGYTDFKTLLAHSEIDLAMVLTPASTHKDIVNAAAISGCDVFCEKPIAVNEDDADAMLSICSESNVKLFYGSCYRYLPAIIKAKAMITEGAIGDVQLLTEQMIGGHGLAAYNELAPIHYPLGGPGGPGMGLVDHGVHLIDIFPWLCNSEIISAQGSGHVSGQAASSEYLLMHLANGAKGHLLYNAATFNTVLPNEGMFSGGQSYLNDSSVAEAGIWESAPGSISVYGSTGSLRIFHYTNALFLCNAQGQTQIPITGRQPFGHFATQLEDIAHVIHHNRAPSVSGEAGAVALKVLLQAYSPQGQSL